MPPKQFFQDKLAAQITECGAQLQTFRSQNGDIYSQPLENLVVKYKILQHNLQEMRQATGQSWEILKDSVTTGLVDLQQALKQLQK